MSYISMSQKDLNKYDVVNSSLRKEITVEKAGELLHLTERQIYNLRAAVKTNGAEGIIHGNRSRPSNRRMSEKERQKIISLLCRHYPDFKPTHASEKLAERHNIRRDPKTIRQIMMKAGLWKPRIRRKSEYHALRPRKGHYGEMEQFDGSYEYWFEDRAPKCCLLAAMDDAAGQVTQAQFTQNEGVFPVFGFWQGYVLTHGKPRSIYLDKLRTYYNNILPEYDENLLTQFQRAMKELGIEPIVAHSPQAKGRIERLFKTFQDRLIKEMRLRSISDIPTANQFLKEEFLPWFNRRYSVEPKEKTDLHRKLGEQEKKQLPAIFSRQTERTIQNDFTLRFNNQWYQLLKEQPATVRPQDKVLLEERLDGSLYIRLRGKYLNYQILPAKPEKLIKQPWVIAASQKTERKSCKPSPDHPWRKPFLFSPSQRYPVSSRV